VGKIAKKAVCKSVFLTPWHCNLSAELTKTHPFRLFFWRFCRLGYASVEGGNFSDAA